LKYYYAREQNPLFIGSISTTSMHSAPCMHTCASMTQLIAEGKYLREKCTYTEHVQIHFQLPLFPTQYGIITIHIVLAIASHLEMIYHIEESMHRLCANTSSSYRRDVSSHGL
jgi:hypothetical protein